jgi:AraC-like DNA-binding protein
LTIAESNSIRDIHFRHRRDPQLGIEIITLEALFRRGLNRMLEYPHRVHFYHLILFTYGCGRHTIDFRDYDYDHSTLMLVSKGEVQQFQVKPENRGLLIIFTAEFLYENATELDLAHSLPVFEHALLTPCIQLSGEQSALLGQLVGLMHQEYLNLSDRLSSEILRHFLRLLLLQIERIQIPSALSQRLAPHYQQFVAFRRLLDRDLGQTRQVQYYARQLGLSPKKLNALIRQVHNKSAKEFIEEQVILEAQRLLAQGDMPIKEIADRLGFSEPTNLVKFFKKGTNISPAAFRRKFQSIV